MKFTYTALDETGKEVSGTIEAESKLAASDALFSKGITATVIEESTGAKAASPAAAELHIGAVQKIEKKAVIQTAKSLKQKIDDYLISISPIPVKEKVVFFRLMAVMINAGISITKALNILIGQTDNKRMQSMLKEVMKDVEGGRSFSESLGEYDDVFEESQIGVIAAGEASGNLNDSLLNLSTEAERSANLKSKIRGAMTYPVIVFAVLIGVVTIIMVQVIPKLTTLFEGASVELPTSTQVMIGISSWFTSSTFLIPNWFLFIGSLVGIAVGVLAWRRTSQGRYVTDDILLRLPIFGTLNKKVALANMTREMATLAEGGVPIIQSIEIAAKSIGNDVYKEYLLEAKIAVEKGVPLSETMAGNARLFPHLVTSMLSVGEQSAQLATASRKVAEYYDEEVDTFVKNLSQIIEPVIIVVVGALVGGLVAAIMQPVLQISDVASRG